MVDDHKYSIGRVVVYRHPAPGWSKREYGRFGPDRTVGVVRRVELGRAPEHVWLYEVENLKTGETTRVPEPDIHHATIGKNNKHAKRTAADAENLADALARALTESTLSRYLRDAVKDILRREQSEERARKEGRDLPVMPGDYVRVRGDLRPEIEQHHNHYAKILEVDEPDIAAIESKGGVHSVRRRYVVLLEDSSQKSIYDPEVKLYYTANGRATILNWRAATFLAEVFNDLPPYNVEYSYLDDHVFSREELDGLPVEDLVNLFAVLLYIKGRMGLRDLEDKHTYFSGVSKEYLVDSVLAISRFDMRKNRNLTAAEIEGKRKEVFKLRRFLRGR
ncbi:MAG: hypothetical protein HYX78_06910 [Armatimonadetes bacterium]|nr:hypothetical protein [Armatimonadota bacterium]